MACSGCGWSDEARSGRSGQGHLQFLYNHIPNYSKDQVLYNKSLHALGLYPCAQTITLQAFEGNLAVLENAICESYVIEGNICT